MVGRDLSASKKGSFFHHRVAVAGSALNNDLLIVQQENANAIQIENQDYQGTGVQRFQRKSQSLNRYSNAVHNRKLLTMSEDKVSKPSADPKTLCFEMLGDVMKVPVRNRPNRTLIQKMLVQTKQSNNVFSDANVSFRRLSQANPQQQKPSIAQIASKYQLTKQSLSEVQEARALIRKRASQNYSRTIPFQLPKHNLGSRDSTPSKLSIDADMKTSSIDGVKKQDELWHVPDLSKEVPITLGDSNEIVTHNNKPSKIRQAHKQPMLNEQSVNQYFNSTFSQSSSGRKNFLRKGFNPQQTGTFNLSSIEDDQPGMLEVHKMVLRQHEQTDYNLHVSQSVALKRRSLKRTLNVFPVQNDDYQIQVALSNLNKSDSQPLRIMAIQQEHMKGEETNRTNELLSQERGLVLESKLTKPLVLKNQEHIQRVGHHTDFTSMNQTMDLKAIYGANGGNKNKSQEGSHAFNSRNIKVSGTLGDTDSLFPQIMKVSTTIDLKRHTVYPQQKCFIKTNMLAGQQMHLQNHENNSNTTPEEGLIKKFQQPILSKSHAKLLRISQQQQRKGSDSNSQHTVRDILQGMMITSNPVRHGVVVPSVTNLIE
ncbi:hypothetical protein FGO68_gene10078 [Halteria grandinella]|uniref:Uncharacterized protein n=1 Tax=Halteria grandinella TaxID=5974 RepID=A0A8J8NTN8_HALGN|nr:hypothetical protein FGO68_gene10078 [Halteria grandinella]